MTRPPGWLPRTMFGRNLLLIVALVALGQLASGAIWYTQVQRPRVDRAAAFVVWHAGTVRTTLAHVPPADRERTLDELNRLRRKGVRIARTVPDIAFDAAESLITFTCSWFSTFSSLTWPDNACFNVPSGPLTEISLGESCTSTLAGNTTGAFPILDIVIPRSPSR